MFAVVALVLVGCGGSSDEPETAGERYSTTPLYIYDGASYILKA